MMYPYYPFFFIFSLALSAFMIAFAFYEDIMNDLYWINENIKAKEPEADILNQINKFIELHGHVKELSEYE